MNPSNVSISTRWWDGILSDPIASAWYSRLKVSTAMFEKDIRIQLQSQREHMFNGMTLQRDELATLD